MCLVIDQINNQSSLKYVDTYLKCGYAKVTDGHWYTPTVKKMFLKKERMYDTLVQLMIFC